MKRVIAILRCLWHGLIPPWLERILYGSCHYIDGKEKPWTYAGHCFANLKSAWTLITFKPLKEEDRRFHKLN